MSSPKICFGFLPATVDSPNTSTTFGFAHGVSTTYALCRRTFSSPTLFIAFWLKCFDNSSFCCSSVGAFTSKTFFISLIDFRRAALYSSSSAAFIFAIWSWDMSSPKICFGFLPATVDSPNTSTTFGLFKFSCRMVSFAIFFSGISTFTSTTLLCERASSEGACLAFPLMPSSSISSIQANGKQWISRLDGVARTPTYMARMRKL